MKSIRSYQMRSFEVMLACASYDQGEQRHCHVWTAPADQGLFCGVEFDRGCGHAFGRARTGKLRQVRLRALPDINTIVSPQIHYYRCLGSDKYQRFAGPVCDNRPVRQDLLDEVVWMEIVRMPEEPQLVQIELDRRLQAAQRANPTKRREDAHRRNLLRIRKSIKSLR